MKTKSAKIMTAAGGIICLSSVILAMFILFGQSSLPVVVPFFLLVAGILTVVFSLAYYTER